MPVPFAWEDDGDDVRERTKDTAAAPAVPMPTREPLGRIIAIANQKGGVGKTTTAVNLSASLAASERRVLLIDIDPQANACSGVGLFDRSGLRGIYEVLLEDALLEEVIRPTGVPFLDLVPANQALTGAEVELVGAMARETRLRQALQKARHRYDYVFIDCPPSLGLLTLNALTAADSVLIPIQCEYYALEGLSQLLNTIRLVQRNLNRDLEIEGVVLTMYDRRLNLSREVVNEARSHFGTKVFEAIVPRNVRLGEAPSHGQPVLLYDILSPGAVSYMKLAGEVLDRESDRGGVGGSRQSEKATAARGASGGDR
jgi:chromosome partitioning protein